MGPNCVPRDKPAWIVAYFNFILPIFSRCLRWHKNDIIRLITKCGSPRDAHLVSMLWWSTLSNVLLKSTSSMRIMEPVERSAYFNLCTISISACTVDIPFSDPYCWGNLAADDGRYAGANEMLQASRQYRRE